MNKKHSNPIVLLLALISGLILGGLLHSQQGDKSIEWMNTFILQPIGQIFLRLIFMVVVPLIFSALVLGVLELASGKAMKAVMGKVLFFTALTSTISVVIGIFLVNFFRPGEGMDVSKSLSSDFLTSAKQLESQAQASKPIQQILVELIPKNPIDAAARAFDGEIIALMVFSLIFGVALSGVLAKSKSRTTADLLQQIFDACLEIVHYAMKLAPLAVFALVFNTGYKLGIEAFKNLGFYVAIVVAGLLIQQFVVYGALLKTFSRISPRIFYKKIREVLLYSFSTASSNATLPRSLEVAEKELGLTPKISRFVLTVGASANQNGTALFEGVTVLFLAQAYGIELSLAQQIQVAFLSILAGIGTAGVPGGSLPLIVLVMQSVGIPAEGIGLILGVDRFLDMCRTMVNVTGDLVVASLVDRKGI